MALSPLPCWEHLSPGDQKEQVAKLIREIEEEAAAQREAAGQPVLGREAVLRQNPHERPVRSKKSYAPLFHAASRKVRRDLYEGYRAFVAAYRSSVADGAVLPNPARFQRRKCRPDWAERRPVRGGRAEGH